MKNMELTMNDYLKDGVMYCGKCNTPKQTKIYVPLLHQDKIFPCRCKCEMEELHLEDRLKKISDTKYELEQYRRIGFSESELLKNNFQNDKYPESILSKLARSYVENFSTNSRGLLLYGNVGTGKTFYASCIANALIDKGTRCLVTNFPKLISTLQGMFNDRQTYIDSLNSFSLLVIDDLGVERDTEYVNEMVTNVIDSRYRIGKPLIVTTNITKQQLYSTNDIAKERIYSRLIEMCELVEVKGEDKRKC